MINNQLKYQTTNKLVYIFFGLLAVTLLNSCAKGGFTTDPGVVRTSVCATGKTCVLLTWDPVTTDLAGNPVTVTGYKIYLGTASRVYTTVVDVGNQVTGTISDLSPGTYYFAVTAYIRADSVPDLESAYSNEVNVDGSSPLAVMGLRETPMSAEATFTIK